MTKALGVKYRSGEGVFEPMMEGDDPFTQEDLDQLRIRLEEDHALEDRGDGHTRILAPGYTLAMDGDKLIAHAPDGGTERIAATGDDIVDIAGRLRDVPEIIRDDIEVCVEDIE